jgi:hypothetical protein
MLNYGGNDNLRKGAISGYDHK